jgi:hypothetical protein
VTEHASGYAARDHEVVDYRMSELPGSGLSFRGPLRVDTLARPGVVCLGAAQTFGCFVDEPFPELLAQDVGTSVLNLGYGGAGPRFFLRHPELLAVAARARVVVVQVMSARSEDNSVFESGGLEYLRRRQDGRRVSAQHGYRELLAGPGSPTSLVGRGQRRLLAPTRRRRTAHVVAETRAAWVESYSTLLAALPVPTVLLWFSRRVPDYEEDLRSVAGLFGAYPQLVRRDMVEAVRPLADRYVECTTSTGLPQRLVSRFTGEPVTIDPAQDRPDLGGQLWSHNDYYPSPQMHQEAALALIPAVRGLLDSSPGS